MLTDPVAAAVPLYTQMPDEVVPPVQLPMIVTVPLDALNIALEFAPKQLPVIVVIPLLLFVTALPFKDDPLVQFPVIESVPLLVFITAPKTVVALAALAPVMLPTILAVDGEAAVNCKQFTFAVALLCVTFAVNVTPEFRMKSPVRVTQLGARHVCGDRDRVTCRSAGFVRCTWNNATHPSCSCVKVARCS